MGDRVCEATGLAKLGPLKALEKGQGEPVFVFTRLVRVKEGLAGRKSWQALGGLRWIESLALCP